MILIAWPSPKTRLAPLDVAASVMYSVFDVVATYNRCQPETVSIKSDPDYTAATGRAIVPSRERSIIKGVVHTRTH